MGFTGETWYPAKKIKKNNNQVEQGEKYIQQLIHPVKIQIGREMPETIIEFWIGRK